MKQHTPNQKYRPREKQKRQRTPLGRRSTGKLQFRKRASPAAIQSSTIAHMEASLHLTEEGTLSEVPAAYPAPVPCVIEPMKAVLTEEPFSDQEWVFETKWDGVRALCFIQNQMSRLVSRNQLDITFRYPELKNLPRWVSAEQVILDGEIVSLGRNGVPNFQRLQSRLGVQNEQEIELLARSQPVVFCIFDLLYYNGYDLMPAELIHRKVLLEQILQQNELLKYSEHVSANGQALFQKAKKDGFEGIIAKHQASSYVQRPRTMYL